MIFNLLILGIVLVMTWTWSTRGFFSALLNLICVFIAGAVAFAFWEPIALALLPVMPSTGFIGFLEGITWPVALLAPFAATLAVLRVGVDSVVKGNIKVAAAVDYVGAGVCGLGASIITAGLIVIAFGFFRVNTAALGYQPIDYATGSNSGSLVRTGGTWVPVDTLTAGLYGQLSKSTLGTATPLGTYYPDLDVAGYAIRISYRDGSVRNALAPSDVSIAGWYTIGTPDAPVSATELLSYREGDDPEPAQQIVSDIDGGTITQGHVAGFMVRISAGAKEESGQVIMGAGQVRLIAISRTNPLDGKALYPAALITRASGNDASVLGRWRFDGPNVFVASPQAESSFDFTYEFMVPAGYEADALMVKNVRIPVAGQPGRTFASGSDRDSAVNLGSVLDEVSPASAVDVATLDTSDSNPVDPDTSIPGSNLRIANFSNQHGYTIERRQAKGLTITERGQITRGDAVFFKEAITGRSGGVGSQNVMVREFALEAGTDMLQVDVSVGSPVSTTARVLREAEARERIRVIGENGIAYDAVGFIYEDDELVKIRFTPGAPLAGKADLDTLTSSREDQKLRLLFAVAARTPITRMIVGDKQIAEFDPPAGR